MEVGFPDYGCSIQTEKTFKNFVTRAPMAEIPMAETTSAEMTAAETLPSEAQSPTELVFFGSLIDSSTMTCRPDFSTLFGRNIAYATTLTCDSFETDAVEKFVVNCLFSVSIEWRFYNDSCFASRVAPPTSLGRSLHRCGFLNRDFFRSAFKNERNIKKGSDVFTDLLVAQLASFERVVQFNRVVLLWLVFPGSFGS